jgi:hypothetical protein
MTETRDPAQRAFLLGIAAFVALAMAALPAAAQSGGFKNTVEAYLMGASMAGTVGAGPVSTDIDVPSSTIFGNLKFAALLDYRGEAAKWAVAADVVYMNLGKAGTSDGGRVSADVGAEEFIVDLVGAYRISRSFEVLAGGRYTGLNSTMTLYGPLNTREAKVNKSWVDPVVGAQAFLPLSETFQLHLRGDIGGFDLGCKFTWQAVVRVNWQVSPLIRLGLGYRWLDQDYESGSGSDYFRWSVLTQGPLVAAGVTF